MAASKNWSERKAAASLKVKEHELVMQDQDRGESGQAQLETTKTQARQEHWGAGSEQEETTVLHMGQPFPCRITSNYELNSQEIAVQSMQNSQGVESYWLF